MSSLEPDGVICIESVRPDWLLLEHAADGHSTQQESLISRVIDFDNMEVAMFCSVLLDNDTWWNEEHKYWFFGTKILPLLHSGWYQRKVLKMLFQKMFFQSCLSVLEYRLIMNILNYFWIRILWKKLKKIIEFLWNKLWDKWF